MRVLLIGLALSVASFTTIAVGPAGANEYPTRPVRLVVPYPPGGVVDVVARLLAPKLSDALKGRFYVENLPGAGGEIGAARAAAAAADGSTILFTAPDFLTIPLVKTKASYDPIAGFTPVTIAVTSPGIISVNPSLGVTSMRELLALLKANPGKYAYATPGFGTLPHLEGEWMLRLSRGLDVVHVPFQGVGPAIVSTIAGQTHILLGGSPSILASQVKEGTLRALVISAAQRSPELPDVPTKDEAGIPEWGGGFWSGVFVPKGTPGKLIALLHRQIAQIMQQPDMKGRLAALDFEPVASPPDEFAAWLGQEYTKWGAVVRDRNLKID
jgi:tripartite-type tricarboxylate transporter receptor subunit TctC